MAENNLEQVSTEEEQLDEFKATADASMIADPVPTKSNKRPADKDVGDKAVPSLSRAGMIGAIVQKLSGFSKSGVSDQYDVIFGKLSFTPKHQNNFITWTNQIAWIYRFFNGSLENFRIS